MQYVEKKNERKHEHGQPAAVTHTLTAKLPFNCTMPETQFLSHNPPMLAENIRHQPDEHFMFSRCVIPNLTEA